jgi:hypothetical protein
MFTERMKYENKHTRQRIIHISNTLSGRNEQINQLDGEILYVLTSIDLSTSFIVVLKNEGILEICSLNEHFLNEVFRFPAKLITASKSIVAFGTYSKTIVN